VEHPAYAPRGDHNILWGCIFIKDRLVPGPANRLLQPALYTLYQTLEVAVSRLARGWGSKEEREERLHGRFGTQVEDPLYRLDGWPTTPRLSGII